MINLEDFIAANGLTADAEAREVNPNMERDPEWARTANHWLVTIRSTLPNGGSMEVPFSQGSAHTEPPTLKDVLDCIASDASSVDDDVSFDDWASELGFFPIYSQKDYQAVLKSYEVTKTQTEQLRQLLGDEAFSTLVWDVERL